MVYENGFIAFLNQAAEQWLAGNTAIRVKFQHLMGDDAQHTERLEQLLRGVFQGRVSGVQAIPRGDGGKPYQITVLPLNPLSRLESIWQRPLALIVVTDLHAKTSLTVEQIQTLIELTAAEARITMGLAEGKNLEEIANARKVPINTARTQLKQSLDKTESRRQAELVKTVSALPKLKTD